MSRQGPDLLIAVKRRALASFHMALVLDVLFVVVALVVPVALDPQRALDSVSANSGAILFMAGALCVLAVPPTWGVVFVVLTLVGAFAGKREPARKGKSAKDRE